MQTVFFILMIVCLLATVGVLGMGLFGMAQAGEFNRRYGNLLMRARVILQGLAVAFFALAILSG